MPFTYTIDMLEESPFIGDKSLNEFINDILLYKEQEIIELLYKLDIRASIKSIKNSLPYQNKISITKYFNSFVNDIFYIQELYRKLLKDLLDKNIHKIRFYLEITLHSAKEDNYYDGVTYTIYYYMHPNKIY